MAFSPCGHKQTHTHIMFWQRERHQVLRRFAQLLVSQNEKEDKTVVVYCSEGSIVLRGTSFHAAVFYHPGLLRVVLKGTAQ